MFAAPAPHVKRKTARFVAARFGIGKACEQVAYAGKNADIGSGVGARRPPDGALVDVDEFVDFYTPAFLSVSPFLIV